MRSVFVLTLLASIAAQTASATPLALSYSVGAGAAGTYETFDSMGSAGTRTPGVVNGAAWDSYWSMIVGGLAPTEQYASLRVAGANNPAVDAYNGGLVGAADRAIGLYTTSNTNPTRNMTARFSNATGAALSAFYLQFDIEFWIQRNTGRWGGLQAWYSPDGATWTNLGNTFEGTLVNTTNSAGLVDGNAAANSIRGVGGQVNLTSLSLAPIAANGTFYLRFSGSTGLTTPTGINANQNRNVGAFLDNMWVGTMSRALVPEPGTSLMLALGLTGLAWRGRKQRA